MAADSGVGGNIFLKLNFAAGATKVLNQTPRAFSPAFSWHFKAPVRRLAGRCASLRTEKPRIRKALSPGRASSRAALSGAGTRIS